MSPSRCIQFKLLSLSSTLITGPARVRDNGVGSVDKSEGDSDSFRGVGLLSC